MIKVENIETCGWKAAFRGMRNPLESHLKADSAWNQEDGLYLIGPNDADLALRLIKAGPEHRKFFRMIHVQMDITAPLYWWKEMDQYRIFATTNSYSTMHKIHSKELTLDDFSHDKLLNDFSIENELFYYGDFETPFTSIECLQLTINMLNMYRRLYLETKDKKYWWQLIQLLPSSYNQKRTWDTTMETVLNVLKQRDHHKLDEWEVIRQACFNQIPYCKDFYNAYTHAVMEGKVD